MLYKPQKTDIHHNNKLNCIKLTVNDALKHTQNQQLNGNITIIQYIDRYKTLLK